MKKIIVIFCLLLISVTSYAREYTINFAWNRCNYSGLTGYKLYQKLPDNKFEEIADILKDSNSCSVVLNINHQAEFVATSYDTEGLESDYSNSVYFLPPAIPQNFIIKDIEVYIRLEGVK